jgi:DNA-binding XRE family transcriptional regulator
MNRGFESKHDSSVTEILRRIPAKMIRDELMRRFITLFESPELEAELSRRKQKKSASVFQEASELKMLRTKHWGNQKELARELRIKQTTLSMAETGARPKSTARILKRVRRLVEEKGIKS